jgi:hypothetical protein
MLLAGEVYREILAHKKKNNLAVPLAVNVEPISLHNLDYAKEMTELLTRLK